MEDKYPASAALHPPIGYAGILMVLDNDLSFEDIQSLSSRDALAAFIGALGYDTNSRIKQSPDALGLTNEPLLREIRHVEQLARMDSIIDHIVYKLYGLTEEEIAVVEGRK